jgi:SAM-dependent methyltransferase
LPRILDLGCGPRKFPGSIGADRLPQTAADVLCDFDREHLPFADNVFDEVRAVHVIEHVADAIRLLEELCRVTRAGGRLLIVTPHCSDASSYADPTHRRHLNSYFLQFFYPGGIHGRDHFYSAARVRERRLRIRLLSLWRWMGLEFLVNHSSRFRRFWEYYLCFVVRGKVMEFELEVLK